MCRGGHIDHITCLHSGTPCNCYGTKYYATEVTQRVESTFSFYSVYTIYIQCTVPLWLSWYKTTCYCTLLSARWFVGLVLLACITRHGLHSWHYSCYAPTLHHGWHDVLALCVTKTSVVVIIVQQIHSNWRVPKMHFLM